MITITKFTRGSVEKGTVNDIKPKRNLWIDLVEPTHEELIIISDKTKIPIHTLKVGLDVDERPRLVPSDKFSLIIFKSPFFEDHEITTASFGIIITKDFIITVKAMEVEALNKIYQLSTGQKKELFHKGTDYFLFEILNNSLIEYFNLLDKIEEEIDNIETQVIKNPKRKLITDIFNMKKTLIYFHKALTANREVISNIEKGYAREISKKNLQLFRQLYYDIAELIDIEGTYREVLTGTLEVHLSASSNNLNEVIKKLTVYATFILVPTLITGIYGMNFKIMPEIAWQYGYVFALGLMVVSVVILYLFFKKEKWI
jgi:magnesium transporter